jgi:hypothetical protein
MVLCTTSDNQLFIIVVDVWGIELHFYWQCYCVNVIVFVSHNVYLFHIMDRLFKVKSKCYFDCICYCEKIT